MATKLEAGNVYHCIPSTSDMSHGASLTAGFPSTKEMNQHTLYYKMLVFGLNMSSFVPFYLKMTYYMKT